ncbi:aldo/keto reductase [uncultured Roseibium sp.]|uniref:aldo/keto reductase n=1 Tax=uncultured Roseibium sp. TaxID=1936171 RepID=UPI002627CCD9|nr:aldo/keto reductase [uncultured Roseibium sp.]
MTEAVRDLSFGASALAGLYRPCDTDAANSVLWAAWAHGIRSFDTAPHYGNGMSERRFGDFLRQKEGWVLSTKVGRVLTPAADAADVVNSFHNPLPFDQHFDFSYEGIMRSVEASFHRLGLNRIDTLYVHDIGDPNAGTDTAGHKKQLLDGGQVALHELKSSGVVKTVGLGVNHTAICRELVPEMDLDQILLAGRYTLLDQSARDELFPTIEKKGVRLVVGGVFNSGILATGPVKGAHYDYAPASDRVLKKVSEIEAICKSHNVPLAAAALQYPARNPLVASTLIGTARTSSLMKNIEQFKTPLPEALWGDLRQAGFIGERE